MRASLIWRLLTAILYLNRVARVFLAHEMHTHDQNLRMQVHA